MIKVTKYQDAYFWSTFYESDSKIVQNEVATYLTGSLPLVHIV